MSDPDAPKSNFFSVFIIFIIALVAGSLYFLGGEVKTGTYVVRQEFLTGKMDAITEEGWFLKLGYTTIFPVSDIIWFSDDATEGSTKDESISIRFNDGAKGNINGSVRFVLPTDKDKLKKLKKQFSNFERIRKELVLPVVREAIYLTASLMSSKESYTNKRNLFSDYAEDQASNGIFRTKAVETSIKDSISGEVFSKTEIEIIKGDNGDFVRKTSALTEYGIELRNFNVIRIKYPENILKQLDEQQQALMDVQKAKAMAQKAEQEAITAEKEGLAKIATAKAEQEVIKIKAVVEAKKSKEVAELKAQQELEVAKLDKMSAEEYKQAKILRSDADAKAAKLLIQADGALTQKLATYERVMTSWADAYTKQRPTPDIVIGGGTGNNSLNSAEQFMNFMSIKALKDLQLDLKTGEGK